MLNEKEISVYIEIAKKPFTLKGFRVKGGFLLLKNSTGKTLAVSSGWASHGCLAVYPIRDDCTYTEVNASYGRPMATIDSHVLPPILTISRI